MKPSIAVDITARDRTDAGRKSAERGFGGFARRTSAMSRESGLAKLGKQVEGLSKFKSLGSGFGAMGRDLSVIGGAMSQVSSGLAGATERALTFGNSGAGAMGLFARAGASAVGVVGGVVAGLTAAGAMTYALGEKWAKMGAEVGRTSKGLDVSAGFLQSRRAAAERFGVSPDEATAGVEGLSSTLYDAKSGANNLALGALNQLGVKLKTNAQGRTDVESAFDDIADAVARQKDPQVQRKIAEIFGMSSMLPALRQGSATLKSEGADYMGSGAAFTDAEVAQSTETARKTARFRQQLSAIEKNTLGVPALSATAGIADGGGKIMTGDYSGLKRGASDLARSGSAAAASLLDGARRAAAVIGSGWRGGGEAPRRVSERAEIAATYFGSLGFTPEQAKGMAAGAFAESGLDPTARNPTSGAIGIGQHLGPRKRQLIQKYGPHPNFMQQLEFMGWELANTETPAATAIRGAATAEQALAAYVKRFMRPAPGGETSGDLQRGSAFIARQWPKGAPPAAVQLAAAAPSARAQSEAMAGPAGEGAQPAPKSEAATPPVARAQVEITLRGAPAGTRAHVSGAPGVDVAMNVARSMDGP